jgi:OmpA family
MQNPCTFEVEPFGADSRLADASALVDEYEDDTPESHQEAARLAEVGRRRGSCPRPRPSPSYSRLHPRGRRRWPRPRPLPPVIVVPPRWPGPIGWQALFASFPGAAGDTPDTIDAADAASLDCRSVVVLDGFDIGDSRLRPNYYAMLVRIARELRNDRQSSVVLRIAGHSDSTRTEVMNGWLSLNRAFRQVLELTGGGRRDHDQADERQSPHCAEYHGRWKAEKSPRRDSTMSSAPIV